MLFGLLRQETKLWSGKILNRRNFGDQEPPCYVEVFQIPVAPPHDCRCVIAGEFSKLLYRQQILVGLHDPRQILDQEICLILSQPRSYVVSSPAFISGRSAVPSRFRLIYFRMYFSVFQIFDNVGSFDLIPSGSFSGVRTWNDSALQKIQGSRFADVGNPIELILAHGLRVQAFQFCDVVPVLPFLPLSYFPS